MRELASRALFDSCVTDPPYELKFMGKKWDGTGVAFQSETWRAVWEVLKPGAHLIAFGGTRTFHRMAVAIEDAGFELRDTLMWVYGTGFPKSHSVSKGIDAKILTGHSNSKGMKAANAARPGFGRVINSTKNNGIMGERSGPKITRDEPATPEAAAWEGWGTALKPAVEPIILARKPLVGTVVENVLAHGTGALNIDGCRVEGGERPWREPRRNDESDEARNTYGKGLAGSKAVADTTTGRWPANLIHDGSDEVLAAFPAAPGQIARAKTDGTPSTNRVYGAMKHGTSQPEPRGDAGSAARFFYSAKATAADRAGSSHPTVKPIALIRYLARLITPPGGRVLDPFAGSGTTLAAAHAEGFAATAIEAEEEYVADIRRRLKDIQRTDIDDWLKGQPPEVRRLFG